MNPMPGETVTLDIGVQAVNGNLGGMYLRSNGQGTFKVVSGQSTKLISNSEVAHSSPKSASGGQVSFRVQWTAPAAPGGVDFDVFAISANGNNNQSGDGAGNAKMSFSYGCNGITYYRDFDGDGVGSEASGTTVNCTVPAGFAAASGDCNDNDERAYPGNTETCNGRDDDCDGETDEEMAISTFYTDADGDGHGVPNGPTQTGCAPPKGFAATSDDCVDTDATRHPGAKEVCNFTDDNCDGRTDEGARVICGVGMCARYGASCDPSLCSPGKPVAETCNALDDDCDGVADNDVTCPTGEACFQGECIPASEIPDAGTSEPGQPDDNGTIASGGCSSTSGALSFAALAILSGLWVLRRGGARRSTMR